LHLVEIDLPRAFHAGYFSPALPRRKRYCPPRFMALQDARHRAIVLETEGINVSEK
jgi:hypothetical protein